MESSFGKSVGILKTNLRFQPQSSDDFLIFGSEEAQTKVRVLALLASRPIRICQDFGAIRNIREGSKSQGLARISKSCEYEKINLVFYGFPSKVLK